MNAFEFGLTVGTMLTKNAAEQPPIAAAERELSGAKFDAKMHNFFNGLRGGLHRLHSNVARIGGLGARASQNIAPILGGYATTLADAHTAFADASGAIHNLYSAPRSRQRDAYEINNAQQRLNALKAQAADPAAPGPVNPPAFKAKGIPGFVDRVSEGIKNFRLPAK